MIQLTILTTEETEHIPENYCREHFPLRFERAKQYRFREDQLRCIGAGVLLDKVLGIREEKLAKNPHGKLYLPESDTGFSLSHSGDYIVLAYGKGKIGVDIEKHSPKHLNLAERVFTPEECAWMRQLPEICAQKTEAADKYGQTAQAAERCGRTAQNPEERFFRLWSMKESVMKALGKGFALPPETFCVLPAVTGRPVIVEDTVLYLRNIPMAGYGLSVCSDVPFTEPITEIHRLNII